MLRACRLFVSIVSIGALAALGCARVATTDVTVGNDAGGGVDVRHLSDAILLTCGNSHLDPTEQCDDGNTASGDGCNQLCQQEANWNCATAGQPCVFIAVCGNGLLTSDEACDDGNKMGGDGCSADCKTVETGWQCRVPGKKCVPLCGDGVLTGTEQCDDGNANSGDGCSSTCLREPGATCPTPGMACIKSVCGNGSRSRPARPATPATRTACSSATAPAAPRPAPRSRSAATPPATTSACAVTCGDGNSRRERAVRRRQSGRRRRLLADLHRSKAGSPARRSPAPTRRPARPTRRSSACRLPITYRDFKSETRGRRSPRLLLPGDDGRDQRQGEAVLRPELGRPREEE